MPKKYWFDSDFKGGFDVFVDGEKFGVFDDFEGKGFRYFPRKTDRLDGDDYIAIGAALNEINQKRKTK